MTDHYARRVEQPSAPHLWWTLTAIVLAFGIWWWRFDYSWATGDQDEFVPYLLHLIDPNVLANDWFVSTQTGMTGVRTPFVILLRGLCVVLSPKAAIAAIFVVSWIAVGWSICEITRMLGGRYIGSMLGVIAVLCMTPKWTLGGNDVVYTMLVPEMSAWAVGLPALVAGCNGRLVRACILVGIAAWLQILVGLQILLLLVIVSLIQPAQNLRTRLVPSIKLAGLAGLVMSPMLVTIAGQQLSHGDSGTRPELDWILAHFRAPYHYLPGAFAASSYVKLGILSVLGCSALLFFRRSGAWTTSHRFAAQILLAVAIVCLTAAMMSEVVPVSAIIKLQLFKTTVVAKVLLVCVTCAAAGKVVSERWPSLSSPGFHLAAIMFSTIFAATVLVMKHVPVPNPTSAVMEKWALTSTSHDARFLVPPSNNSFRSRAGRAIVVNYAAVPFAPTDLREWYVRINDVAPVSHPAMSIRLKSQLDSSYHTRGLGDWRTLADKYSIDYLVLDRSKADAAPLSVAYQDSAWVVYRLAALRSMD